MTDDGLPRTPPEPREGNRVRLIFDVDDRGEITSDSIIGNEKSPPRNEAQRA